MISLFCQIQAMLAVIFFTAWFRHYLKVRVELISRRRSIRKQNRLRYKNMGY